jgi:surfeit locus 1 family protein
MNRQYFPIIPTILVGAAVIIMLMLGMWQLERRTEKAGQLVTYQANIQKTELVAMPMMRPVPDAALFRRTQVDCTPVGDSIIRGGKDRTVDTTIFRTLVKCAMPASNAVMADKRQSKAAHYYLDIGGTDNLDQKIIYSLPIRTTGMISMMPGDGVFSRLIGTAQPPEMLIIADQAAATGLVPSAYPNVEDVPNDHLAYAIQWFLFAGFALLIYGLALRKRVKGG